MLLAIEFIPKLRFFERSDFANSYLFADVFFVALLDGTAMLSQSFLEAEVAEH
jgi:hypothetical protein